MASDRSGPDRTESTLSAARLTVATRRARAEAGVGAQLLTSEPIAILGMGCRFSGGAKSPSDYWRLLDEGRSGIREIADDRWPNEREALPPLLRQGGYLDGIDRFDPEFFGIAPREAPSIDPQQRLLLEVCWEALLNAGIAPGSLSGTETGVFAAIYNSDYSRLQMRNGKHFDEYTGVGSAHSVAAGRISFLLNLRGPCLAVDTACSSSLVAIHLACQALRRRECDVALAGGTSLKLLPDEVRVFAAWGMLSRDGRTKTFDAAADGFVPGEGCGVVVLKRFSDAIAQGDIIRAVVRGTAVNHDGRSSVLTAPSGPAQEAVIRSALRDAQIRPGDVSFVEAHGTGTSLGDPIEVEALDAVYGAGTASASLACMVGAVKTNLGHLEAAAGVAGLIKVVLSLEKQAIPRNLNFDRLNPQVRLAKGSRLQLATEPALWPRGPQPRFAAVSSFGLGGTNAHVVLEEAPVLPRIAEPVSPGRREFCLPISAHSRESLLAQLQAHSALLRQPEADLAQIACVAARTRDHLAFRVAVVGTSATEAAEKLEAILASKMEATGDASDAFQAQPRLAFVFSGQGSLWRGMLTALEMEFPEAAKVLATCETLVQQTAGWSLRAASEDPVMLEDTAKSQPLLFAMQMALVETLTGWGIVPNAVVGHSVGEVAAAVTAGILPMEQAMRLVLKRGERMGETPSGEESGRMMAAEMNVEEASLALSNCSFAQDGPAPEIAAVNGPRSVVFSGPKSKLQALADKLNARSVEVRWLDVRYAFHSQAMAGASGALTADLRTEFSSAPSRSRPTVPMVSTVTGRPWGEKDDNAEYWGAGIRRPVLFRQAVDQLLTSGCSAVVEIGPHPVLLHSVKACAEAIGNDLTGGGSENGVLTLSSMRRGRSARGTLMSAVASLYEAGASLAWQKIYPGAVARVEIPGYSWNRRRFWIADDGPMPTAPVPREYTGDLPGREIASPFVEGRLWQAELSTDTQPWLAEHCWNQRPIFPFAAWVEVARRAGSAAAGSVPVVLRDFAVHQPLTLGTEPTSLQTFASPAGELKLAAEIDGSWKTFASGYWQPDSAAEANPAIDPASLKSQATETIAGEQVYRELNENGLTYGPSFRLLERVYAGDGFALGELAPSSHAIADATGHGLPILHPVVLDACLQTVQAAQPSELRRRAVLPMSVASYRVLRSAEPAFALVRMESAGQDEAEGDVLVLDRQGVLICEIKGLRVRRVEAEVRHSLLWQTDWEPAEDEGRSPAGEDCEVWVIPAAEQSDGTLARCCDAVALELEGQGFSVQRSYSSSSVHAGQGEPIRVLLAGPLAAAASHLVQIIRHERDFPGSVQQVCVITRGAQAVHTGESTDPEQASLRGLARTFRAEYPAIATYLVDLPLGSAPALEPGPALAAGIAADEAKFVSRWLASEALGRSAEAALRNGRFVKPRLKPWREAEADAGERLLTVQTPGLLETLHEEPFKVTEPLHGEVQIACHTHGLNFRDVLTAMGSYAGQASPMGGECAGVVVRAASGTGFTPGMPVLAFAPSSLRTVVNVPAAFVAAKPAGMSFAEAATIPVAFLTAHYAFTRLARLQPGQTVLVHSGAGGLGQAAVQIATWLGVKVIATAGTEAKRAYLMARGVQHVFDSRSDEFADSVLCVTGGRGVDVVLNALSGEEKIAAGFRALAHGGVFLEVGKRDIWSPERAALVRPDVSFFAFDLGEVARRDSALATEMMQELMVGFAAGALSPLPYEVWPIGEAEDAFRLMASGRHVGKLVLAQPAQRIDEESWKRALQQGTILITGGTGALGIATAQWLIEEGARSIVLIGRRSASDAVKRLQEAASARGVRVSVECADVAERQEVDAVLRRARSFPDAPLRMVFHAAGEVDDRLLAEATAESLAPCLSSKVEGARLLDEMTAQDRLLITIYYSSVAAPLGSAGQGSYAAANAYLDGLAEQRSARGLATVSVNWGAWAEGGMFDRLSEQAKLRMARQGVRPMASAAALVALGTAILSGRPRVTIADVQWPAWVDQFPSDSPARAWFSEYVPQDSHDSDRIVARPLTAHTSPTQTARAATEEIAAIRTATKSERAPRMEAFVRASARKVLGLSSDYSVPGETPLQRLGLDSLMALELRNLLSQALGRPLRATLLFDYSTVRALAQYLLGLVVEEEDGVGKDAGKLREGRQSDREDSGVAAKDSDLSSLSDSEAEELLLAELDRGQRS